MSVTILLVEDDPLLLTVLRELLEFGGHSVVTCVNGREAVQQLSVTQIDLVVTDLSMPEMDGLELIKVLTFEWPDIRVIAMSGFLDCRARQLTEMYGVDALLEKPFSIEEMLNVVQFPSVQKLASERIESKHLGSETEGCESSEALVSFSFSIRPSSLQVALREPLTLRREGLKLISLPDTARVSQTLSWNGIFLNLFEASMPKQFWESPPDILCPGLEPI